MKLVLVTICMSFLFTTSAQFNTSTKANADSVEAKMLEGLSVSWMNAMLSQDSALLVKLMTPEFILYSWDGSSNTPRDRWISNLLNKLRIVNWEQTSIHAKVYGETAVVNSLYKWQGTHTGRQFDAAGFLTDVWVKRNNKWQVLSRSSGSYPGSEMQRQK